MKRLRLNINYLVPLILGIVLFSIVSIWGYHEMRIFGDRTKKMIEQEGNITIKAIKGIIQSQMFGKKISKRRLEFLLDNIVDQTILKYVCIKKNDEVIFKSKSNVLNDSTSDLYSDNIYYFSSSIKLQKLPPPPPPPPPPRPPLFHSSYHKMEPGMNSIFKANGKVATDRIIDSIKTENEFRKHPEDFINFAKSNQTITIGIDISMFKEQLNNELRKTFVFYLITCAAIAVWIFAWIYFLKNSRLKLKYTEIKEKTAKLEELSLAASGLAHEVKNPLGIVRGLTQNILKNCDKSLISNLAEKIIDEVDITTERLSDFMNYAKHRAPHLDKMDLQKYFNEISDMIRFELDEKQMDLKIELNEISILADKEFLDQIVINILMNSINACSKGNIISVKSMIVKPDTCVLYIVDDGPGIEEALVNDIFKPYISRNPEGHGIGLAIVKKLIDALNWEINVESQIETGTKTIISNIKTVI